MREVVVLGIVVAVVVFWGVHRIVRRIRSRNHCGISTQDCSVSCHGCRPSEGDQRGTDLTLPS